MFLGIAAFCAYCLWSAWKSGEIPTGPPEGSTYASRSRQPIFFWIEFVVFAMLAALMLTMAIWF